MTLAQHIVSRGLTFKAASEALTAFGLACTPQCVGNWAAGRRTPRPAAMAKLIEWSDGAITADSFLHSLPAPSGSANGADPGADGAAAPEGAPSPAVANAVRPSFITGDAA